MKVSLYYVFVCLFVTVATFINKVNVTVSSETFHNGRVKWTLEAGDHTHHVLQRKYITHTRLE